MSKDHDIEIHQIKNSVKELLSLSKAFDKRISAAEKRLNDITPHIVEKYLNDAREDAREVHNKYKLLILKQTVATEACFYVRTSSPEILHLISSTIVRMFDEPDSFWEKHEHAELAKWVKIIVEYTGIYSRRDKGKNEKQ